MKLIGMLDSPFVRRTAIGMKLLNLNFEHQSLSVFRNYDEFQAINPLVKAPTLVLDGGKTLVDSSLILQYAERIADMSLLPKDDAAFELQTHVIGTALIANEKSVQIYYEHNLRPAEKQHAPWLTRVQEQLNHAYSMLESTIIEHDELFQADRLNHASIAVAVAWMFTTQVCPEAIDIEKFPTLEAWSATAESTRSV